MTIAKKITLPETAVLANVCEQIKNGNKSIRGIMLESHLHAGRQQHYPDQPLKYGQSITDPCLSWEQTVPLLEMLADTVK